MYLRMMTTFSCVLGVAITIPTTMARTQITDIPPELIERIIYCLSARDSTALTRVCRYLRDSTLSSPLYRYKRKLYLSASQNNPISKLSITERLDLLTRREDAWANMRPDFISTIRIPFTPGGLYDLSNGKYFLGDASRLSLSYIELPKKKDDPPPNWKKFDMHNGREILDFAVAEDEHDLLAAVT